MAEERVKCQLCENIGKPNFEIGYAKENAKGYVCGDHTLEQKLAAIEKKHLQIKLVWEEKNKTN